MARRNSGRYILDERGDPVECPDIIAWWQWLSMAHRHVANDVLENGVRVSTVFLGLDHACDGGIPLLYETMIFGGPHDEYQERYATRTAAIDGHKRAVELAAPSI